MKKGASNTDKQAKAPATKKNSSKKQVPSNIVLTTLTIAATGILGYLGWQYLNKRRNSRATSANLNTILQSSAPAYSTTNSYTDTATSTVPSYIAPVTSSSTTTKKPNSASNSGSNAFPLKKGSKGEAVKKMQQALINKYGSSILPKYGADGDFGTETITGLTKVGLPTTIDESTYNVIVQGGSSITDKSGLANKFLAAATTGNFSTVISLLKQMSTKDDYRQVNASFSQSRLWGVRQTLVNGLLGSFSDENQKQQIRYEFIRMGLRYDGSKWSLDGLDGRTIITIAPTNIWFSATQKKLVPKKTVLGTEVSQILDYTKFENKGKYFLVATNSIEYL